MSNIISGNLGYKGEQGLSAYEVAVKHGYTGTEEEWLRSLGTSSMFNQYTASYTTTEATTDFALPEEYIDGAIVNVYVGGSYTPSSAYSIVSSNDEYLVRFDDAIASSTDVELVVLNISTNNLPISADLNSSSTNDTASGSKAVYDYIENKTSTSIGSSSTDATFPTALAVKSYVEQEIENVEENIEYEEIPIIVESGIQQLQPIKMYKFGRVYSITGGVSKNWSTPSNNFKKLFKIPTEYIPTGIFIVPVTAIKVGVGTTTCDNTKTHIGLIQDGNDYFIGLYDNSLTTAETVYFNICYMK